MNIDNIINLVNDDNTIVRLHLAHPTNSKNKLIIVSPDIISNLKEQLRIIVSNKLNSCKDINQEPYNMIGSNDSTLEVEDKDRYLDNINNVLEEIGKNGKSNNINSFSNDNFKFFIYEFYSKEKNKSIYAFRRTTKFKRFKKGFIGYLNSGGFSNLSDENWLAADSNVDLIIDENKILILQHISFERIFNLDDKFIESATKVLDNDVFKEKIVNFNDLKNDALNNYNNVKRLSKLNRDNDATLFLKDINKTKNVIDKLDLDISFSSDGKLIYDDKSQITQFINLMKDAYYVTLIGNKDGVDGRK